MIVEFRQYHYVQIMPDEIEQPSRAWMEHIITSKPVWVYREKMDERDIRVLKMMMARLNSTAA